MKRRKINKKIYALGVAAVLLLGCGSAYTEVMAQEDPGAEAEIALSEYQEETEAELILSECPEDSAQARQAAEEESRLAAEAEAARQAAEEESRLAAEAEAARQAAEEESRLAAEAEAARQAAEEESRLAAEAEAARQAAEEESRRAAEAEAAQEESRRTAEAETTCPAVAAETASRTTETGNAQAETEAEVPTAAEAAAQPSSERETTRPAEEPQRSAEHADGAAASETQAASAGKTSEGSEDQDQRIKLDFLPVELKAELPECLQAGNFYPALLEIRNLTDKSLEQMELTLSSGKENYIITAFKNETDARNGLADLYGEETREDAGKRILRIRTILPGETLKTEIFLYAAADTVIPDEGLEAEVECLFRAGNTGFSREDHWNLTREMQDSAAEEPTTEPTDPAAEEPTTEPTDPAAEEPTTGPTDPAAEEPTAEPTDPAAEEPTTEPADPAAEEPTTEPTDPTAEEPTTEPETDDLSLAEITDPEESKDDPSSESGQEDGDNPAGEELSESENASENSTDTVSDSNTPEDDEIVTFDVIPDENEEGTEDEEYYYDDFGYYGDWTTYSSLDDTQINTATPYVLIKSYGHKKSIYTGDAFRLEMTFLNTSQKVNMENVVIKVETSDALSLENGTNTLFVNGIDAGGTSTQNIRLLAGNECKDPSQKVDLSITYEYIENKERKQGTATESITLPVAQKDRLELQDPVYDIMQAGQEGVISIPYVNKGFSSLYNMEAVLSVENAPAVQSRIYAGNVESGKSGTLDFIVTPNEEGDYSGIVTLTYEDSTQKEISLDIPVSFTAEMAYVPEMFDMEEDYEEEAEQVQAGFPIPWYLAAGGGALVILVITIISVNRKKKARLAEETDADDWFQEK